MATSMRLEPLTVRPAGALPTSTAERLKRKLEMLDELVALSAAAAQTVRDATRKGDTATASKAVIALAQVRGLATRVHQEIKSETDDEDGWVAYWIEQGRRKLAKVQAMQAAAAAGRWPA